MSFYDPFNHVDWIPKDSDRPKTGSWETVLVPALTNSTVITTLESLFSSSSSITTNNESCFPNDRWPISQFPWIKNSDKKYCTYIPNQFISHTTLVQFPSWQSVNASTKMFTSEFGYHSKFFLFLFSFLSFNYYFKENCLLELNFKNVLTFEEEKLIYDLFDSYVWRDFFLK